VPNLPIINNHPIFFTGLILKVLHKKKIIVRYAFKKSEKSFPNSPLLIVIGIFIHLIIYMCYINIICVLLLLSSILIKCIKSVLVHKVLAEEY